MSLQLSAPTSNAVPGIDVWSHTILPAAAGHAATARLSRPDCASQLCVARTASNCVWPGWQYSAPVKAVVVGLVVGVVVVVSEVVAVVVSVTV